MSAKRADLEANLWQCTNSAYHADRTCESNSSLGLFDEDPITYWRARIMQIEPMPTCSAEAVNLGSAFEYALLEPAEYTRLVKVTPHNFRTKGFAAFADSLAKENLDFVALPESEAALIPPMLESVKANAEAMALLSKPGQTQVTIRWRCPSTGVWLKLRADKLLDCGQMLQLKTTRHKTKGMYAKQAGDLDYHVAEALYRQGRDTAIAAGVINLGDVEDHTAIVVSNDAPFITRVYDFDTDSRDAGEAKLERILQRLVTYRETRGDRQCWFPSGHGTRETLRLRKYKLEGEGDED